jgi:hypothetical protein
VKSVHSTSYIAAAEGKDYMHTSTICHWQLRHRSFTLLL